MHQDIGVNRFRRLAAAALCCLIFALPDARAAVEGLTPANPQPDAAALAPGLSVKYYYGMFRKISQLESMMRNAKGQVGKAIPQLNYRVGTGNVLTSNHNNGVGAWIWGLINFAEAGGFVLKVNSNDGVKVIVGGRLIHTDPNVHADTMSDPIPLKIDKPGWYPLQIRYFERKNTSTLQLFWSTPGGRSGLVPAEAFAHRK